MVDFEKLIGGGVRIEGDGTPSGTDVRDCDGNRVGWIRAIYWHLDPEQRSRFGPGVSLEIFLAPESDQYALFEVPLLSIDVDTGRTGEPKVNMSEGPSV